MENQTNKPQVTPEKNKKKTSNRLYQVFLIIACIIIAGLIVWLFLTHTNLNNLLAEKENQRVELHAELDSLLIHHEIVKEEYGELSDTLALKDSIILANADEIRILLNTKWEYYKVKKKLRSLQKISQGYVRQMDSLYRVNKALAEENIIIRRDLNTERREKEAIIKDKAVLTEKVEMASVLYTYNMSANGIRSKSGGGKEKITDKAKKVDKIKVCFTLGKNEIIPPGEIEIYIRIAKPDEEVLTKDKTHEYTFEYQGESIQYSILKTINYENIPIDLCLYWYNRYKSLPMMVGIYHVDIFNDGKNIGHTTFQLR